VIRIAQAGDPRLDDYRLLGDAAALARAGLFVAEGRFVVQRLLAQTRFRARSLLLTHTALAALGDMVPRSDDAPAVYVVDQALMNGVTGFNMHRGCLAIGERGAVDDLDALDLASLRRVVMLEAVNNPDNVGGIFRSAAALGADAVVIGPGCSDPLYRKAIRTSMAATLQLPFVYAREWPAAIVTARDAGFTVLALTPSAEARPLADLSGDLPRVALLVGAEGDGLSPAASAAATDRVRIPMARDVDSLNVTVAASIALYHFNSLPRVSGPSHSITSTRMPPAAMHHNMACGSAMPSSRRPPIT
jgi:tRNA G18 (ribose-2'-O)-methylase SpoU